MTQYQKPKLSYTPQEEKMCRLANMVWTSHAVIAFETLQSAVMLVFRSMLAVRWFELHVGKKGV